MRLNLYRTPLLLLALLASSSANADFGVGVKAGTLGIGVEGRFSALPWLDVRVGVNRYDYDDNGLQAGISYDGTLALESAYVTGNFRFPLSPFRVTAGAFSNGNEFRLQTQDGGNTRFNIGGRDFSAANVGTLQSKTSFGSTAPYLGIGYDFEVFGKVGLNLDLGVLWQGDPDVTLEATGLSSAPLEIRDDLRSALETERLELEDEVSDFKAWPVMSLAFIYNF
ncbi:MAG: hypothetical protein KJN77_07305 [Gammaproteobacteria bacterium]|nr:hypothetical protein [Gammaproteobacteria bacterium]